MAIPRLVLLVLAVALWPASLFATVGYDAEAEVLGYDARDHKVYFLRSGEPGEPPRVYYFDLDAKAPGDAVQVRSWEEEAHAQSEQSVDAYLDARLETLRERLVPLERAVSETLELEGSLRPDGEIASPTAPEFDLPRYAVELELTLGALGGKLQATAYCRRTVELGEVYAVPDAEAAVAVVGYVGDPLETCYMVREVVLLLPARPHPPPPSP